MADTHRLVARAIRDSEVSTTKHGTKCCTLKLICEHGHADFRTTTLWNIACYESRNKQLYDFAVKYCKKGSIVDVLCDHLVPRAYVDKNGKTMVALNATGLAIYTIPKKRTDEEQVDRPVYQPPTSEPSGPPKTGGKTSGYDDEILFKVEPEWGDDPLG